jgi:hypothetical protein
MVYVEREVQIRRLLTLQIIALICSYIDRNIYL